MDYKGVEYLRRKLAKKRTRVLTRYEFYEMKDRTKDLGIATPPHLMWWTNSLGWCTKAVDSLSDRLRFREFRNDNFAMTEIFQMNNPDVLFDSAIRSALIASCSFIYISRDETGYPRLQVIDGGNGTGIIDEITGLLKEGYAVLARDPDKGNPTLEAYFTDEETIWYSAGEEMQRERNAAGYPLLVPIIYKPDAARPFGHSRISRSCMDLQSSAVRAVKRMEIAAEFYSFPQKYVTGLSQDAEPLEKWRAAMSSMLVFQRDDQGEYPTLGQFQQASMTPHTEMLRTLASMFAGETGLTLDDLGFATENPSSAEAIKAGHESLRVTARDAQQTFGSGLLNTGFVAACLRDAFPYERTLIRETVPVWEPLFEPDAAMLSSIGDGAIKINQAIPNYITEDTMRDLTGISTGA